MIDLTADQQLRRIALEEASKLPNLGSDKILEAAEKYYAFLSGGADVKTDPNPTVGPTDPWGEAIDFGRKWIDQMLKPEPPKRPKSGTEY